jgi:hypothetical protein
MSMALPRYSIFSTKWRKSIDGKSATSVEEIESPQNIILARLPIQRLRECNLS